MGMALLIGDLWAGSDECDALLTSIRVALSPLHADLTDWHRGAQRTFQDRASPKAGPIVLAFGGMQ